MERKMTRKRALALLLALEMLCAPLAIARVQDPEQAVRETPLGEEVLGPSAGSSRPAVLPGEDPADTDQDPAAEENTAQTLALESNAYYNVYMSFGAPLIPAGTGGQFSEYLAEYDYYLRYEADRVGSLTWGYRSSKFAVEKNGELYTTLPAVGRVPDKELEGFYIAGALPEGDNWYSGYNSRRDLLTWSFDQRWFEDEAAAEGYRLVPVEGDPVADYGFVNNSAYDSDDEDVFYKDYTTVARIPVTADTVKSFHEQEPYYEGGETTFSVPVLARWKASGRSDVTAMNMAITDQDGAKETRTSVYTEDPRGKETPAVLELADLDSGSPREFWLRVSEEEESLTLAFTTFEPYYNYNVKGEGDCPVTARYTFPGAQGEVEVDLNAAGHVHAGTWDETAGAYAEPITPAPEFRNGVAYAPANSASDPARGQWTVDSIPLTKVDEAADPDADPFTTITITVTAPDGVGVTNYVIHVERLTTPVSTLGYGNTPYGMIAKDTSARWKDENKVEGESEAETIAKNKQAAKDYFRENHTFTDMPIRPADSGSLYAGEYSTLAWSGAANNLDLNENAVVAYLDMAFADPGVSFIDSEGRKVHFGASAADSRYTNCVKRTLRLLVAENALTPDLYGAAASAGGVSEVWYVGGSVRVDTMEASQILQNADGSDVVDLRGLKVLPGVYTMTYTFFDPVNRDQVTIDRPLVVLPIPGDVDMDGAVTHADAKVLQENRAVWDAESSPVFRLLRQRVYNDAQVKVGDLSGVAAIRNGFHPSYTGGSSNYFYRPLDTSQVYTRKTWAEVTAGEGAQTKLELRYLGPEGGALDERGHTNNITGPWKADPTEGVSLRNDKYPDAKDTFWVGVYLELGAGSDLAGLAVRDLTLSLTYDSEFVEPAVVYSFGSDNAYTTDDQRWENITYYSFNMGDNSTDENNRGMTIFSGKRGNDYGREGFSRGRAYTTHYSKVTGELEQAASNSNLRELVISLQNTNRSNAATLKSGCLLVLPFRLVKHPEGRLNSNNMARLIELSAGMGDLTLVTPAVNAGLTGASQRQIQWMAELMETTTGVRAAAEQTYAFSAQSDIYGGATRNLRAEVDCQPTADGLILLGENNTASTKLYNQALGSGKNENAKYDVAFLYRNLPQDVDFDQSTLPPGLTYYAYDGHIEGTPTAASTPLKEPDTDGNHYKPYVFNIKGNLYSIVVEPRVIRFTVDGRSSYYGEAEYRGADSTDFTFAYTVADLADRDVAGLTDAPTGNGAELSAILAGQHYVAPVFSALNTATGQVVQRNTPVGHYPIQVSTEPKADNYRFEFTSGPELNIAARPIYVDSITADYAAMGSDVAKSYNAQIYNNDNLNARTFTVDEAKGHGALTLTLPQIIDGKYGNLPLDAAGAARVGDDKLKLTFRGRFQRSEYDEGFQDNYIHLQNRQETRPIGDVSELVLDPNWATNQNYTLVYRGGAQTPENNAIQGIVLRCGINSIKITNVPGELNGTTSVAGSSIISPKTLRVQLDLENNVQLGDFAYDVIFDFGAESLMVWDLHYNWVSPEEMAAGKADPSGITGTGLHYDDEGKLVDTNPYGSGVLTTSMDGWYLCVAARKYDTREGEEVEFVKTYSQNCLYITRRPITLTPRSSTRFYGDKNANLTYTYDWRQLSTAEQQRIKELMGYSSRENPKGTPEELEALLKDKGGQYVLPTIAAVKTAAIPRSEDDLVKADTPRGTGQFYVVLYGAESDDYAFRYTQVGATVTSNDFGLANFQVFRRPIVLGDIYSAVDPQAGTTSQENFATIYSDSRTLFLANQVDNDKTPASTPFTADLSRVTFKTAGRNAKGEVTYYTHTDGTNGDRATQVTRTDVDYADTDVSVLEKDRSALKVSYTVRFIPDNDRDPNGNALYGVWNDFTSNFFAVEALSAAGGSDQRPVEIGDLELTGEAANNYLLVFDNEQQALKETPANAQAYAAPEPDARRITSYQRYGTGTVILRPIEAMSLKSQGKMSYTYGEVWSPIQPNGNHNLTLEVRYATRFDNDRANNTHSETLRYAQAKIPDPDDPTQEIDTDNFTQRGFTIYYLGAGSASTAAAKQAAVAAGQRLENNDRLYPLIHNNASIFVVGKRGENDPEIYSEVGAQPLKVRKAALTLTASDMHRFYGESNATAYPQAFTYTYDQSQLASWDRPAVYTGVPAELEGLDGYAIPAITTTAVPSSPVNGEQWGEYGVVFSQTKFEFDNYVVTGEPGTLYVYPRPIQVGDIRSSQTTDGGQPGPVYTIYNATSATQFTAQYATDEGRLTISLPNVAGTDSYPQQLVNPNAPGGPALGAARSLPLTGDTLVGSDVLAFNASLSIQTPSLWKLAEGASDAQHADMKVVISSLAGGDTARNYRLDNAGRQFENCWGAVKLRTIDHIHIMQKPKLDYIYGDALDLSGLRVRIDYKAGQGETAGSFTTVPYIDPEQFKSYGLYINYWDEGDRAPADSDARKAIPGRYRKAHTGDHVTIAPTHDTQQYIGTHYDDPLRKPFAANGKTLIISAFQATTVEGAQVAAVPVILGATPVKIHNLDVYDYTPLASGAGTDSGTNATATIRVNPRRLTYTLTAEDKTYDGTTQAAGTVTLTNLFDAMTQIQVTSDERIVRESVKDAVFLPIGASYESDSTNYADFSALTATLQNGRVAFRTGTYQPNEPGLLSANKTIAWANGYTYGGDRLTFTFVNPNVHYEDDAFDTGRPGIGPDADYDWTHSQTLGEVTSAHDVYNPISALPVEVTNMRLLGPDAANYTWGAPEAARVDVTEVKTATRASTQNGQAAAPFATIHKANRQALQGRSALPTLAVDLHSNAIRLGLTQNVADLGDRGDEFSGELHFEYALFYDRDGLFTVWAGDEGDHDHQDTLFFGGETVRPYIDPAYIPDLNRLPKAETAGENTIYKGQLYPWAEEDAGMYRDAAAYPGGENAADAYWFYSLYNTARQALPRGTVFYPLVRLSETHNYNPSADLSGDAGITADSLEAAKAAVAALTADQENETLKAEAQAASAAVLSAAEAMKSAAEKASADKVQADLERSENSANKDEITDLPVTASAVKTFTQRLDILSASRERNGEGEDRNTEYLVELLEAVWFTDTLHYEAVKHLDSVVDNTPARYYGYYWDVDHSAQLRFTSDEPVDFTGDLLVSIRPKDGEAREVNVNPADDQHGGARTAKIYVSTESSGGNKVRTIQIVPRALYVRLGDPPYPLGVITNPPKPSNRVYTWTTSDPEVATVDENGVVTFRGVGEAVITVTTTNNKTASIRVVVSQVLPLPEAEHPLFNFNFDRAWEETDENGAFRPHEPMTRAQLTVLMDIFLNPEAQWKATAELAYVDVTGKERWYEALSRLSGAGVVQGVPGQAFAGEQPVTRAEFAAMLCRMLQLEVPDTAGQIHMFEDAGQAETWAYAYIDALAKTGVMRGVGGGKFAPDRVLTREESAAVIARLLVTRLSSDQTDLKIPTDMTPANWSYEYVIRAINAIAYPD